MIPVQMEFSIGSRFAASLNHQLMKISKEIINTKEG
jgi:hypothetical protein